MNCGQSAVKPRVRDQCREAIKALPPLITVLPRAKTSGILCNRKPTAFKPHQGSPEGRRWKLGGTATAEHWFDLCHRRQAEHGHEAPIQPLLPTPKPRGGADAPRAPERPGTAAAITEQLQSPPLWPPAAQRTPPQRASQIGCKHGLSPNGPNTAGRALLLSQYTAIACSKNTLINQAAQAGVGEHSTTLIKAKS